MTHDSSLFTSTKLLSAPIYVTLPDGTVKKVIQVGQLPLNKHITRYEVLFVPESKFHLLSVYKLLNDYPLCAIFFPDKCFFQDLTTKLVIDSGFKADGLYQLKIPKADKALS